MDTLTEDGIELPVFEGDSDPLAPRLRALDWLYRFSSLGDIELSSYVQQLVLVVRLRPAAAGLYRYTVLCELELVERFEDGNLAELVEAAAAYLETFPPDQRPAYFLSEPDRCRMIAFIERSR